MPSIFSKYLFFSLFSFLLFFTKVDDETILTFKFKGKKIKLEYLASQNTIPTDLHPYSKDTMSNLFFEDRNYVEIIRQSDPTQPRFGIAIGFEFEEANGEYPYTPAKSVVQFKDFAYGGVQFENRDTCNYTGVSNEVSNDITIEIDAFENDTITGRFSGLLINGAGKMAAMEEGKFKIHLIRVN
jgi:hypothetical protein